MSIIDSINKQSYYDCTKQPNETFIVSLLSKLELLAILLSTVLIQYWCKNYKLIIFLAHCNVLAHWFRKKSYIWRYYYIWRSCLWRTNVVEKIKMSVRKKYFIRTYLLKKEYKATKWMTIRTSFFSTNKSFRKRF